ncbi:hypothetical protein HYALB_00008347 [Hymenoscyphus albidus]|uniref:chitinase n=1 Tax=Hymenoscyphus albidus TaxID=595503 RepID=A0A9N9LU44_9HELO|nr:hypothetical protein HYALB_00008347 [Hymenoscyphus albidus]
MLFPSLPSLAAAALLTHFAFAAPVGDDADGNTRHAPQAVKSNVKAAAGGYKNAAYYVNWAIYARNYQPQQLPASQLTHVLYAFANIQTDGTVYLSDTWSDTDKHYATDSWNDVGNNVYGCAKQLFLIKKKNRQMKTLLSIGGWTYSTNFAAAASTAATRSQFASTAVAYVKNLGFDGIDIDWEYPKTDAEASNFVLLLAAVRSALGAYAAQSAPGYHFLITIASPAGPTNYNILHMRDMDPYLDAWHLMAYDYSGSWDTIAGHDANLYPSVPNPGSTPFSTQKAITDYIAAGVTPSKLVMGLPLYGRSFQNTNGMGSSFNGVGTGSWENGVWDYKALPKAGATEFTDAATGASYSYDSSTRELISYDNVATIQQKANFIKSNGLGGAMFWETSGDRTGVSSLISTIAESFAGLEQTQNWLSYPASSYDNMRAGFPGE